MAGVVELHDVKSAAVDVEVDVAFFKVRGEGFPFASIRMTCFDFVPDGLSDAFALTIDADEEQFQLIVSSFRVDFHDRSAGNGAIQKRGVCDCAGSIQRLIDVAFRKDRFRGRAEFTLVTVLEGLPHFALEFQKIRFFQ